MPISLTRVAFALELQIYPNNQRYAAELQNYLPQNSIASGTWAAKYCFLYHQCL